MWYAESLETLEIVGGPWKDKFEAIAWGKDSDVRGKLAIVEREHLPLEPVAVVHRKDLSSSQIKALMNMMESGDLVVVQRPRGWLSIYVVKQ